MSGILQGRQIHVDQHLSNVAINFRPGGFIADQVFPMVSVAKQSDSFLIWEQSDLFRRENTRRSRGSEANKITTRVSSSNYYADNYALKTNVALEDKVNKDAAFIRQFESGKVTRITDSLLIDWEVRIATQVTNTANVGSSAAVGSAWTDLANSDPVGDLWTAIDNVEFSTGVRPNRVVFGKKAWRDFHRNNNVIDKARATALTGAALSINESLAAAVLDIDRVTVGNAFYNTAEEGIDQVLVPVWGDHVLIYFAPDAPSIDMPSFGYSFRWNAPGLPNMQAERHAFDSKTKTEEIEVGYYQDEVVTSAPLGFLVTNTTSSTT